MMLRFVSEESGTKTFDGVDIILNSTTDKDTFTVGRALSSDLVIALPSLSREHCKFTFRKSGKWFLEDTSSSGTWVNDKQLLKNKPRVLKDKDVIKLSTDFIVYEFKSLPCVGEGLEGLGNNSPLKVNDKKPLGQLSSTPDHNIKENATLDGYVPESQIKVLAAEEADKRKKLEQTYAADLLAQKTKYEEELRDVKVKLQLAEQRETTFKIKQEEWKHEKEFLTYDVEKRKNQAEKVRDEYAQQLEDEKHKLQVEVERRGKESKISEHVVQKLEAKVQELQQLTDKHCTRLKEKELILEDNKLLLQEKIRLEEEVQRLTKALELSSSQVAKLVGDKDILCKEKNTLNTTIEDLQLNLAQTEVTKNMETANQLQTFEELMESELQCAICTEIVVNAQTLICGHTFCQVCIDEWREKNPQCPNCRKKVKRTYPSKVLDGFVGKMVDNLTTDFKRKREQIIIEKDEHVAYKRMRLVGFQAEPEAFIDLTTAPNHDQV